MNQDVHRAAHAAEKEGNSSPGAVLTQARLARQLEIKDVASGLRLSIEQVQALEGDDFDRLGAPVFIKGYLVRYARLLGLPEDDLVMRYRHAAGQLEPPPLKVIRSVKPQTRSTDWRLLSYPVVLFGVAWLGWWGYQQASDYLDGGASLDVALFGIWSGEDSEPAGSPEPPGSVFAGNLDQSTVALRVQSAEAPPAATVPAVTPGTGRDGGHTDGPATASSEEAPESPGPLIATVIPPPEPRPAAERDAARVTGEDSTVVTARSGDTVLVPGNHTELVLSVSEDCWVEVRDSTGERLAYGVLRAQTVNHLQGVPPFSITLGNAQAVEMTVGGRPVAEDIFRPARGSVSRFVLNPASLW